MEEIFKKIKFNGFVENKFAVTDDQIITLVSNDEGVKCVYVLTKLTDNTWSKELLEMDEGISCLRQLTDNSFVVGDIYNTITVWKKGDLVWKKDNTLDCDRTRMGQIVIDESIVGLAPLPDGRIVSITHNDIVVWGNDGDGWFPDRLLELYTENEYCKDEVFKREIVSLLVKDGVVIIECDDGIMNTYKKIEGDWKLFRSDIL